jgi:transposase-like protein
MPYSEMFKRKIVQRMCGPEALSATALSKQVGVGQGTLSKWLRQAGVATAYGFPNDPKRVPEQVNAMAPRRRPEDWSAEEKLKAVLEAQVLSEEALGAFLRQRGLHEAHLARWRQQMIEGLRPVGKPARSHPADLKRIRTLEHELKRKDKALAETAAILVLKKKVLEIWGDVDESTAGSNDK